MMSILKILGYSAASLIVILIAYLFIGWPRTYGSKQLGITWSAPYAKHLGIDSQEGLRATLADLGVRSFRIPAYWTDGEPTKERYAWQWLDEQLDLIHRYGGRVTLVIGIKQPRWPECWIPEWAKELTWEDRRQAFLVFAEKTVQRYASHPAIERWQVENEPTFFTEFGDCAGYTSDDLIQNEIDLIKQAEAIAYPDGARRPIVSTASGEFSTWLPINKGLNALGVSVYRVVANDYLERWGYWFLPPWFYHRKATLVSWLTGPIFISEFQMEPWVRVAATQLTNEQQFVTFDLEQMKKNVSYAERIDLPRIDFWGAEWWYWMKTQREHPEFWEEAKSLFRGHD